MVMKAVIVMTEVMNAVVMKFVVMRAAMVKGGDRDGIPNFFFLWSFIFLLPFFF